jgi:hypothetical protein
VTARKRPRLEEPVATSTYDATYANGSHDTTVALPPLDAAADHADSDPVMDMHPKNPRASTGATSRWTPDEDKKLKDVLLRTHGPKNWETLAGMQQMA